MPDFRSIENDFLQKTIEIIENNISSELFGVSELAQETGMSRSNLLRKIKKLTGLSVSQFIRQIKLEFAREILEEGALTVSEVSYKVGFSSTSYFIKCFREHYGFPPGELGKHPELKNEETGSEKAETEKIKKKSSIGILGTYIIIVLFAIVLFFLVKPLLFKSKVAEKSIAVLPFKNDSSDSTNVYFINGLMESTLNNLQKIEDLRVISRTSVEKYRNNQKTAPEIARELNVNYIIEGSGQKIGEEILLNIQLINARNDEHLWAEQYKKKATDIFALQSEIAKNITERIEVIVSPEVKQRIDKIPTKNYEAYDYLLKGIDLLNKGTPEKARQSISYFKKAIELDNEFARAYAAAAMAYHTMDEGQVEIQFADSINYYADRAMFNDSQLPQSLIAKALFYMINQEYELAVPYLEKALEYNPNFDLVYVYLLDLYANHLPDTEKYLEYALRGLKIDISSYDSTIASFNYLHIANAFIQAGFVDQAEKYINKSLEYKPDNLYSEYTKAYILYAKNGDLEQTEELLIEALKKDSTRLDIMQELAKIYYYQRDYQNAYRYYKKFVDIREAFHLDIYNSEDAKIAYVFYQTGNNKEAEKLMEEFRIYAENDNSIYKHSSLAVYYSYKGDTKKALEHLQEFSTQNHYFYWTVLFIPIEPLLNNITNLPEFKTTFNKIETKFNNWHNQIESSLKSKGLI